MKNSVDYAAIGRRIRQERAARQMSQFTLAELTDMSPANLSHIEHGSTMLSLPAVVAIANALDVTVDALLHDNLGHLNTGNETLERLLLELRDCTDAELSVIAETVVTLKRSLKKNMSAANAGTDRKKTNGAENNTKP